MKKEHVIARIKKEIGITYPDHIADAVGIGLWLQRAGRTKKE